MTAGRFQMIYHELQVREFSFESLHGPTAIARDGEVGVAHTHAHFSALYRALKVYQPTGTGS